VLVVCPAKVDGCWLGMVTSYAPSGYGSKEGDVRYLHNDAFGTFRVDIAAPFEAPIGRLSIVGCGVSALWHATHTQQPHMRARGPP